MAITREVAVGNVWAPARSALRTDRYGSVGDGEREAINAEGSQIVVRETASPPIGRPKTFDRDRVIGIAMECYWREGVDGVLLNELCRRAAVSKPGVYREFGGEDGLMDAVVPPQNPVDGAIVGVSVLGVKLAHSDASQLVRPARNRQIEPPREFRRLNYMSAASMTGLL